MIKDYSGLFWFCFSLYVQFNVSDEVYLQGFRYGGGGRYDFFRFSNPPPPHQNRCSTHGVYTPLKNEAPHLKTPPPPLKREAPFYEMISRKSTTKNNSKSG